MVWFLFCFFGKAMLSSNDWNRSTSLLGSQSSHYLCSVHSGLWCRLTLRHCFCSCLLHCLPQSLPVQSSVCSSCNVSPTIGIWSNLGDWCVSPLHSDILKIEVISQSSAINTSQNKMCHARSISWMLRHPGCGHTASLRQRISSIFGLKLPEKKVSKKDFILMKSRQNSDTFSDFIHIYHQLKCSITIIKTFSICKDSS